MQISVSSNYVYVFCFLNSNTHPTTSPYMVNNQVLQPCKERCNVMCKSDVLSAMLLTMQVVWHVTLCWWGNGPRRFEEGMAILRNYLPNDLEHSRTLQSCGYTKSVNVW